MRATVNNNTLSPCVWCWIRHRWITPVFCFHISGDYDKRINSARDTPKTITMVQLNSSERRADSGRISTGLWRELSLSSHWSCTRPRNMSPCRDEWHFSVFNKYTGQNHTEKSADGLRQQRRLAQRNKLCRYVFKRTQEHTGEMEGKRTRGMWTSAI